MHKGVFFWLVVVSLVFTRMVGLHLHACAGYESVSSHAGTHLADNGFLFGEHHVEDDGDDTEIEAIGLTSTSPQYDSGDFAAIASAYSIVVNATERRLALLAPRGPPSALPSHPLFFLPPLRGPPAHSLA